VLDFIVEQARSKNRTAPEPAIAAATESRLLLVCEAILEMLETGVRLDVLAAVFANWMMPLGARAEPAGWTGEAGLAGVWCAPAVRTAGSIA
jgi:hypothetical protein